ncbi:MAG: alkaline phosphatase family protein [Thermoanaerobaculales bacterium]|nr:alkaline phosphatase family protein [Thermoanaerobaculales bacterium]
MKRKSHSWPAALYAGAVAGTLGLILVLRLNPDIQAGMRTFFLGVPLWMSWGAFMVGVPFGLTTFVLRRPAARRGLGIGELVASLLVVTFVVGALLSWINAEIHPEFLSTTGRRQLLQDSVIWFGGAILVMTFAWLWRKFGRRRSYAAVVLPLAALLPIMRLMGEPTSFQARTAVEVSPLGQPSRTLMVCGVEGLDSTVLMTHAAGRFHPHLDLFLEQGAWGSTDPFLPFLDLAHWTTLATGTLPRRHGVMFRVGWQYPTAFDGTLRLLPWTPQGSRLFLAWDRGRSTAPPYSTIPPLWQRLISSGVPTFALDWPGQWNAGAAVQKGPMKIGPWRSAPAAQEALEALLAETFPGESRLILRMLDQDRARVDEAVAAIEGGSRDVWLVLRGLAEVRRQLEPHRPRDAGRREVMALVVELLDSHLGRLLNVMPDDGLAAVVSPYGLAPPDAAERLRRLLGVGGDWRASAQTCPDGVLLLMGDGVVAGERFSPVRLEDMAPTICYLLDLPLAQYMEGRVILDAIDPDWLRDHPLRVVE